MTSKEQNTEQKILEAAKSVFLQKGMEGSRMQEIADEAGINKALLHYYFRSKEKLFLAIFQSTLVKIIPAIEVITETDLPIFEKIKIFIGNYMDAILENPYIPQFIINEVNRCPENLHQILTEKGVDVPGVFSVFQNEMNAGRIRRVDPRSLMINILSLCLLPVAAKPLFQRVFFQDGENSYQLYLAERKNEVANLIIATLEP